MADRYDPKLSVRPLSERKAATPAAADEDPLVELARIVSGRTTFDPGPAQRTKTVPANASVSSDVALANDLESELLNDLQASFSSTFYAPPPPPPPTPAAQRPTAQPAKPASPPPAKPPSAAVASLAAPPPAQPAQAEKPAVKPDRPPPLAAARTDKPASLAPPAPAKSERFAAPAPGERAPLARQSSVAAEKPEKIDLPEAQLRSTSAPHPAPAEAAPAKPAGRWERPAEPRATAPDPSRFAPPPRGAALFRPKGPPPEPEPEEDELPDLAALGEGATEDDSFEDEGPPPEDLDVLPQLYDEDDNELPPFPDELEELSSRRPRRGLLAGAAVLAVVLAAGVAFVMSRSESSVATPPVITADATPAKIVPAATPTDNGEQGKLFQDRVGGAQSADGTKLVTPGDEPVADSPATATDADNPISRVIAPGGPGFDPPVTDAEPAAGDAASDATADASAASDADGGSIPPKKVRTVIVRPDLTVVSSGPAAADAAGKAPADAPAVPPAAAASAEASPDAPPKAAQTDGVVDNGQGLPIPLDADPLSSGGDKTASAGGAPADPAEPVAPGSVPADDGDAAAAAAAADGGAAAGADASAGPPVAAVAAPTPPAKPAEKPAGKPAVLATRGGPVDLAPAKTGKAAPAAPSSGVLVQVSAQKSEDAAKASYRDLQGKFPSILGRFDPNIQRADLGEKGVYYRVRVGPFAAADAQRLCGDLQAAGGTCLIAKR